MKRLAASVVFFLAAVLPAQSQSGVDVRGTLGATKAFLDEPFAIVAGGAILIHIGQRFVIGPEYLFSHVSGFYDRSFFATGIYFLSQPNQRIRPYVTGSFGVVRDHDTAINYTARELSVGGGAGVRIPVGKGLFVSPEIRIGSNAFPMVTGHLGYSF